MPIHNSSYRTRLRGNLSNPYRRPFQRPSPCSFRCTSPVKPAVHYTQSLPYPPHFRDGKNPPKRMPLRQNRGKRGVHGEKPAKRMPSRAFSAENHTCGAKLATILWKSIRFGRISPRRGPIRRYFEKGNTFRAFSATLEKIQTKRCRPDYSGRHLAYSISIAYFPETLFHLKHYFTEGVSDGSFGAVLMFTLGACGALPWPKETTGAADAAALASKLSRLVKPKGPATSTPGNV